MTNLALYESLSRLSAAMVSAAQANDWERLCELEAKVARLRDALAAPLRLSAAGAEDTARKIELIHHILDNDAEIRRHTEPWMESVRRFLGGATKGRTMRASYDNVARL